MSFRKLAGLFFLLAASVSGVAQSVNYSSTLPAAPSGYINIHFQHDNNNPINVSAYVPNFSTTPRPIGFVVFFAVPYTSSLSLPIYTIPSGVTTTIAFPANCSGSTYTGTANAAVNTTFTVKKDGTTACVGTIAASSSSISWATGYSAVTLASSDSLAVTYSGDTNLAGSLQLNATRTN